MKHLPLIKSVVSAVGLCGLVIASYSWAARDGIDNIETTLQADDLVVVQAGEKIYQAQCAACHGSELQGQANWRSRDANGMLPAPPHNSEGHTWHHADDLLFEITKYGPATVIGDSNYKTAMPPYKDILNDEQIIAVLSFIKNTWPEEQRSWQDEVNGAPSDRFKPAQQKKPSLIERLLK